MLVDTNTFSDLSKTKLDGNCSNQMDKDSFKSRRIEPKKFVWIYRMIYISFPLRISLTSASMQYAFIWMISLTSLAFWIFHSFALICLFLSLSLSLPMTCYCSRRMQCMKRRKPDPVKWTTFATFALLLLFFHFLSRTNIGYFQNKYGHNRSRCAQQLIGKNKAT